MKAKSILLTLIVLQFFCTHKSDNINIDNLEELPRELKNTLDPLTFTTRIEEKEIIKTPTKSTQNIPLLLPCCGGYNYFNLKVKYSAFTGRCIEIDAPIFYPVINNIKELYGLDIIQTFKITELNGVKLKKVKLCLFSYGPWNALLTQGSGCASGGYGNWLLSVDVLGQIQTFHWQGEVSDHPSKIKLVECNGYQKQHFKCSGISTCDCPSNIKCVPTQNDNCDCSGYISGW